VSATSSATRLASVRPELQELARRIEASALAEGIRLEWVQGWRSESDQAALWAQGRQRRNGEWTRIGATVTEAEHAIQTPHGRGAALDFAVLDAGGRPTWASASLPLYERVGRIAEGLGLEWGGRFPRVDRPHLQISGWRACPYLWPPPGQT
jgi:D-alanyl-D-alanine dipeptidase